MQELNALYVGKQWHQLTNEIEKFIETHENDDLSVIYEKFIKGYDSSFNRIRWAKIVGLIARTTNNPVEFLSDIKGRYNQRTDADSEAYMYILLCLAQQLQIQGYKNSQSLEKDLADQNIDEVKKLMEERVGDLTYSTHLTLEMPVEDPVRALLNLVLAEKAHFQSNFSSYYTHMLLYLSLTPLSSMRLPQQKEIAKSLSLAALVCSNVYTFGELASHPILLSLRNTSDQWLSDLINIFDEASPEKYVNFVEKNVEIIKMVPLLLNNNQNLKKKIRISSFISYVFSLPSDERIISFNKIALVSRVPEEDVEALVLRSFATEMVKGRIDEVDKIVVIDDVKPRLLSFHQVGLLRNKMEEWQDKAKESLSFVNQQMDQYNE